MGCPVPVHCRQCDEPLDVYMGFRERFCSEECADIHAAGRALKEPFTLSLDELKAELSKRDAL